MRRSLPLLFLLLLPQVALSQHRSTLAAVPESCLVTKPSDRPFIPPPPYPVKRSKDYFWFGTDRLWTSLPVKGTWGRLGHYEPDDPTFRQKLFFWRQGYDWHTEPRPNLKVVGRRLDAPAAPLLADRANNVTSEPAAMVVGINFPTTGCWEITGHFENDEVTFVVWIPE
jgi:hypothetical protein